MGDLKKGQFWNDENGEYLPQDGEEIQEKFSFAGATYILTNKAIAILVPKPKKSWRQKLASFIMAALGEGSIIDALADFMDSGAKKIDGNLTLNLKIKNYIGTRIPYEHVDYYVCSDQDTIEFTGNGTEHRHAARISVRFLSSKGKPFFKTDVPEDEEQNWIRVDFLARDFEYCAKFMLQLQKNKPLPR